MTATPFLSQIFEETLIRVQQKHAALSLQALEVVAKGRQPLRFVERLTEAKKVRVPVIAELKRRSPSQGDLFLGANAETVALGYASAGSICLSVLTEPSHFCGSLQDLVSVRKVLPSVPLLMKDFVIDKIQIAEGAAAGADAVLLMVSLLEPRLLSELLAYANSLSLTAIVEVHNSAELEVALSVGATVIGVNNRDLRTLRVSLQTSRDLIASIPEGVFAICESGLSTSFEVTEMLGLGFDACLVGTSLMKSVDPTIALHKLIGSRI